MSGVVFRHTLITVVAFVHLPLLGHLLPRLARPCQLDRLDCRYRLLLVRMNLHYFLVLTLHTQTCLQAVLTVDRIQACMQAQVDLELARFPTPDAYVNSQPKY
jgi:hypothetical protein